MNQTANRETTAMVEMATEVTAEHTADGCCTADAPCTVVAYYQDRLLAIGEGRTERSTPDFKSDVAGHRPAAGAKAGNQFGTFQVKYATEPQRKYLSFLLQSRDLTDLSERNAGIVAKARVALEAGQISKRHSSDALDILTTLPVLETAPVANAPRSNRYGAKCIRCGGWVEAEAGRLAKDANGKWAADHNGECPKVEAKAPVAAPARRELTKDDAGMYEAADGTFYRVYFGQQSGKMLAKRVVGSETEGFDLEYAGLAERFVTGARYLSLEEHKAWGKATETCMVCGRRLDDPESVDAGIGPVCAGRFA